MHHPIQMKPADTENRNGNRFKLYFGLNYSAGTSIKIFLIYKII